MNILWKFRGGFPEIYWEPPSTLYLRKSKHIFSIGLGTAIFNSVKIYHPKKIIILNYATEGSGGIAHAKKTMNGIGKQHWSWNLFPVQVLVSGQWEGYLICRLNPKWAEDVVQIGVDRKAEGSSRGCRPITHCCLNKSATMEAARNLLLRRFFLFLWRLRLRLTLCLRNQALGHFHMLFVRLHVLVSLGSMCVQRMSQTNGDKHGTCIQKRNMRSNKIQAMLKPGNILQHPLRWLSVCVPTKSRQILAALSYVQFIFGFWLAHRSSKHQRNVCVSRSVSIWRSDGNLDFPTLRITGPSNGRVLTCIT